MAGDSIVDTSRVRPHRISHLLAGEGLVVMVANARLDAEGRMEQIKPLQFDGGVAALLEGVTGGLQ